MIYPTMTRCQFTALQKQDAVEFCLAEGLACRADAQRLCVPNSTLAMWDREVRIDREVAGDTG